MLTLATTIYRGGAVTDGVRTGSVRADDASFVLPYVPPVPGPWDGQPGTNPEQLLAGAWAICFHGLLGPAARSRDVDLDEVRVGVAVELGETAEQRLGLSAEITVDAPHLPAELLSELIDEAYRACPFCQAMAGNIRVDLRTGPVARELSVTSPGHDGEEI